MTAPELLLESEVAPAYSVLIEVRGTPAPKGSARAMKNQFTGKAQLVTGGSPQNRAALRSWDVNVRDAAVEAVGPREAPVYVGRPLEVLLTFRLRRPAGHYGKHGVLPKAPPFPAGKPDGDKLARATLDSLTGCVFDDDARIVRLVVEKVWARPGDEGARIEIRDRRP